MKSATTFLQIRFALNQFSRFTTAIVFGGVLLGTSISCVSVNIGPKKAERSVGVQYQTPKDPFKPMASTRADEAWQNKDNGNSISYFSTCNDPADPPLENVTRELFADLQNMKTLRSNSRSFNGREALETEVEGQIDGVLTRIHSLVFKKNKCLYTLSFIGLAKSFPDDQAKFEEFMRSFDAP